jgi:hypothetical protein
MARSSAHLSAIRIPARAGKVAFTFAPVRLRGQDGCLHKDGFDAKQAETST